MVLRKLVVVAGMSTALMYGASAMAQQDLSCADIDWSPVVTDKVPDVAKACDEVVVKDGKMYARVSVELQRVRGRTLTFKILNNDGTSGGSYKQTVEPSWRASIAGRSYRASELSRGQELNIYMPSDRWAVIPMDDDGPDEEDAVMIVLAPEMPETAGFLPLAGLLGGGFMILAAGLGAMRRRLS